MTKRTILLTLFLLFGFLPTAGLFLWGSYRHTGWYVQNWNSRAERILEIPVKTDSIVHCTPGSGRLYGISFFMPENTEEKPLLAQMPSASWVKYTALREGKEIQFLKWTLPELKLTPNCLETLWTVHQRFLSSQEWHGKELLIELEKDGMVQLGFEDEAALCLHQAELRIRTQKGIPVTEISFFVPETNRQAKVFLSLRCVLKNGSRSILATLKTDVGGLPTHYLTTLFPMLNSLGPDARFTGAIEIQQTFSRWSGFFRGKFDAVDVSAFLPEKNLTGKGTLVVKNARFDASQLIFADGEFRCIQGTISRTFLERLANMTQLAVRGVQETDDVLNFQEFAFRFQIRNAQMQIFGECGGRESGVFLTGPEGPMLSEPTFPREPFSRALLMDAIF